MAMMKAATAVTVKVRTMAASIARVRAAALAMTALR